MVAHAHRLLEQVLVAIADEMLELTNMNDRPNSGAPEAPAAECPVPHDAGSRT